MSDQMKYLLVAVALCCWGCGKPEANNPGDDRPEAEKTPYEKLISGSVEYRYSHEAADFGAEVCRAMLQAEPFEIASWRKVMKDYGFSDQVMAHWKTTWENGCLWVRSPVAENWQWRSGKLPATEQSTFETLAVQSRRLRRSGKSLGCTTSPTRSGWSASWILIWGYVTRIVVGSNRPPTLSQRQRCKPCAL